MNRAYLPQALHAAYNWTEAAGELDELRSLADWPAALASYATASAANAAEADQEQADPAEREPLRERNLRDGLGDRLEVVPGKNDRCLFEQRGVVRLIGH